MAEKQFLVTMTDGRSMVQHLVKGDISDARTVMAGLEMGIYRYKFREGSIIEITNDDIILYMSDINGYNVAKRELDKDIYIVQTFKTKGTKYAIEYGSTTSEDELKEELDKLEKEGLTKDTVANKISYRGVSRIKGKTQTRIKYIGYTYIKETKTVKFHDEPEVVKL